MTIKQQGGVFGRNPTFNDVNIEGDLSLGSGVANTGLDAKTSAIALNSGLTNSNAIPALGATPRSGEIRGYSNAAFGSSNGFLRMSAGGSTSEQAYIDLTAYFVNAADRSNVRLGTAGTERFAIDYNGNAHMRTGNLSFISGKGIDFSATSGTGTSELFDDYEEGTWTPTDASGAGLSFTSPVGVYTKVGRLVMATGYVRYPSTSNTSNTLIGGLPFTTVSGNAIGSGSINYKQTASVDTLNIDPTATTFGFYTETGSFTTNNQVSNQVIYFGLIYTAS